MTATRPDLESPRLGNVSPNYTTLTDRMVRFLVEEGARPEDILAGYYTVSSTSYRWLLNKAAEIGEAAERHDRTKEASDGKE